MIEHPKAATFISGDKNNLDERNILALNPMFHQIVSRNTRNNKILTILITDLPGFYHVPQVIPPVPVDVPGHGVPSNHNGVLLSLCLQHVHNVMQRSEKLLSDPFQTPW